MGVALRSDGAARSADERPALPAGGRSAASRARDEQQRRRALTNDRLPGLRLGRHPAVTACQIDKRQAPSPSPQRSERLPCLLFAQPSIPGCATQTGPGPCRHHCVTRWGRLSSDGRRASAWERGNKNKKPEEIVEAIEKHGVTRTQMLPTGLEDLVEYLEVHPGANLKTWKSATAGWISMAGT